MPNYLFGYPLVDPRKERSNRLRWNRDEIHELEYANALYLPGGRNPARGWFLMRQGYLANIPQFSTSLTLQLDECIEGEDPQDFTGLAMVQARCVSMGIASDPNAVYLVELTDARGVICNRFFKQGFIAFYNVQAPAYQGSNESDPMTYTTGSLSSGTDVWSWTTMITDIWNQIGLLGAFPGLPVSPTSYPVNYSFPGVSIWDALCDVLDLIGCEVACDLTEGTYSIVSKGADDADFDSLILDALPFVKDDLAWIDVGSGRIPAQVLVLFHQRYQYFGTEETVRRDSFQWSNNAIYSVAVSTGFSSSAGAAYLWDDFVVRVDNLGNPISADVTKATSIASERVTQYLGEIYWQTIGYLNRTYNGLWPFATGSLCNGVCWKEAFNTNTRRQGWTTQIMRGSLWPEYFLPTDVREINK